MAHILVVEDESQLRSLIQKILELEGHVVIQATNGLDAIRMVKQTPLDLVITDILMPGKDGFELLMHMREHSLKIPVLVISGGGRTLHASELLENAQLMGASGILHKPFKMLDLLQTVEKLIQPTPS